MKERESKNTGPKECKIEKAEGTVCERLRRRIEKNEKESVRPQFGLGEFPRLPGDHFSKQQE